MFGKNPITSKTFWVNILAIIGLFVAPEIGIPTDEWNSQYVAAFLVIINLILRVFTGEPIDWSAVPKLSDFGK